MMKMTTCKIDIQALRLRSVAKFPYLASALWAMTLVETDQVPSMGVDRRWRLYVNPRTFEGWTREQKLAYAATGERQQLTEGGA